jgi:hypothetical protein
MGSAARSETAIKERAKLGRLDHLDAKADPLEKREGVLRTADEAPHLRAAASNTKAERKG